MNRLLGISVAFVGFGLYHHGSAPRVSPPETRHFVYSGEKDGDGGETVIRNGDEISGEMWIGEHHAYYEGRIAADGTIPRLDIRAWRSAAEATNPRIASVIISGDSAKLIEHLGNHVDTLRFAAQPGMVPLVNPSMGLIEVIVARARSRESRSAKIPFLLIDGLNLDTPKGAQVGAMPAVADITFLAADTVKLGNGSSTDQMRIVVGADGRIRSAANGSTARDQFSIHAK